MADTPAEVPPDGKVGTGASPAGSAPVAAHSAEPAWLVIVWSRIKEHKIVQWTVAYAAFAFVTLHAATLVSDALEWPHVIVRALTLILMIGLPMAPILAWYHGVRALTRVSIPEFVLIVLLLALGGTLLWRLPHPVTEPTRAQADSSTTAPTVTPSVAAVFAPTPHSIAVLPFADLSEKHDQEYFADGMAEELADLLTQVPELHVAARTSSSYFKGRSDDVATIAQKLRVAHVLQGSVRKAGDLLRVTVQLVRADDGYQLWSQMYQRNLTDVFKVQDEIAAAVVEALKVRLLPTERIANQHQTTNVEAYSQYLLGNHLRTSDTPEANAQALVAFQKAIALDPSYAAAYSALAVTEWRIADQVSGEAAAYKRAAEAADRAIELAPVSPDGYWARGDLRYLNQFDWKGARSDFDKAFELDPKDVRTLVSYGRLLATLDRIPDAITMTRKAIDLDPLSIEAWDWLAYYQMVSGQLPAAQETIRRELQISREGTAIETVWNVALLADGPQAALAALPQRFKEGALYGTAVVEHSLGHTAESQRALDELIKYRADTWAFQIGCIYAWRGEKDRAFEWLERAYRQHDAGMTRLSLDPLLAALRSDPRYKALVQKMNLRA